VPEFEQRLRAALGASYTIERELGGGGMSRVFVAEDTALARPVVIKVLHPELAAGVNVDRFKREVQLLARLQHPHIVPILSAGEVDGLPYYIMPFVRGESLRARLDKGPMAPAEAAGLLADVAKALGAAHSEGVVHRDIKPDNILISGGAAVVADFGIAKALSTARLKEDSSTLTSLGTSLGTPAYMAPEQVAGDPNVDARADLYSLG
jgi:serine/threonine-protein kinase